ncbi:MAG: hypothetical protein K9N51_01290 [Candidatus Pacebacteria bacterium]|nr:hypothetical protein [Candidatus Paceibacterota bacterium]
MDEALLRPLVLFIRGGALGDFILSMPLLKALSQQRNPICLITRKRYLNIVPPGCRVDYFLDIESQAVAPLFHDVTRASRRIRNLLHGTRVYAFCHRDSSLQENLENADIEYFHRLEPRPAKPPHVIEQFFKDADVPLPDDVLTRPLWPEDDLEGDKLWLHPGSGSPSKNADLEILAQLAADWQNAYEKPVCVSFGEADLSLRDPLERRFEGRGIAFETVVMPSLVELKNGLQREARIFVGNDSGVTHLAGALGIPAVALFVSTDPRIWHPIGTAKSNVLSKAIETNDAWTRLVANLL